MRRHVFDKVPVSNLCDEYGIQPSMFYNWQKVLADNAVRAFTPESRERDRPSREAELEQKIAQLQAKLGQKKRHHRRDFRGVRHSKKRAWGALSSRWVPMTCATK